MLNELIVTDTRRDIAALAKRHRAARSVGMQVLNIIGGHAENLLERLPDMAKDRLEDATRSALGVALDAAQASRGRVPDQKDWLNTAVTTAMGAAGGVGGLPTALAELPVTTTILMRAILGIAAEYGFDPETDDTRTEALTVFANLGPLEEDDGADMAFLAARLTLSGATMHRMLAQVAPRLAAALGKKLAAQTVPVIGAVAGAGINYAYTSYYQQMAHVHFGLMRLEHQSGVARAELIEDLRRELKSPTSS